MIRSLWAVSLVFLLTASLVHADEQKKEIDSLDEANTVDEITDYVSQATIKLNAERPKNKDENLKLIRKRGELSIAAGEKILKIVNEESEQLKGLKLKIAGLKQLILADRISQNNPQDELKESENQTKLNNFIDELKKENKFPLIVNNEQFAKFVAETFKIRSNFSAEKFDDLIQKAKKWSITKPAEFKPVTPLVRTIDIAAFKAEIDNDPKLVEKTIKNFIDFVNSDEFTLSESDKKATLETLEGYLRRIVGANPEIYGKTLDDKDFNWDELKGKYVLVKFTASWCGPCKGEIPGMISAYEKYHDKGLEIVSIYVWDKLNATKKIVESEKIPWIIISEELTEKAGQSLQGKKFAISGVPTMFLVDKEGKILTTEARGEKLQNKLAEIFGDKESSITKKTKQKSIPEKPKNETASASPAKKVNKESVPALLIIPKNQ
jgi:thiol-disulfide isomerase/thioredoxin